MCNIAGYVGSRPAAPILLDMIRREEGFAGGYYTGIATIHEGRIHCAKVVGDAEALLSQTNAASLPGSVGFVHSRSKSGGGEGWAHPFACLKNGEIASAYVANGSTGFFKASSARADELGNFLLEKGYTFTSRGEVVGNYPLLSDGTGIHMSDLMAQLIQYHMDRGADGATAMTEAFCRMPAEIVGLLLTLAEPDMIAWSRINMPMFLGTAEHGTYLASSSLAFPSDSGEPTLLPPMASGRVYSDRYTVIPYEKNVCHMGKIDDRLIVEAYRRINLLLSDGEYPFSALYKELKDLFDGCDCCDSEPLAYQVLQMLADEGKLTWENARVSGVTDELTAPKTYFSLRK